jgi:hypothetical protein
VTVQKAMDRRCLGAASLLLLGACSPQSDLLDQPDKVWASSKSMESAASCAIRVLDERGRSESSVAPSVTFAKHVIEPGKVYEIRPEQRGAVTPEYAVLRLEKIDDRITRMSLFAHSPWKKDLIRALRPCGARS